MYTLLLSLVILASFLFFQSSKRVKFERRPQWLLRLVEKRQILKCISLGLLGACGIITMWVQGIGSGFFAFFAYVMTAFCIIILLYPYRFIGTAYVLGIFLTALLLELFIFNSF